MLLLKTTKLTMPAAKGTPISVNNLTNGLLSGSTLNHGMTDMITSKPPI